MAPDDHVEVGVGVPLVVEQLTQHERHVEVPLERLSLAAFGCHFRRLLEGLVQLVDAVDLRGGKIAFLPWRGEDLLGFFGHALLKQDIVHAVLVI